MAQDRFIPQGSPLLGMPRLAPARIVTQAGWLPHNGDNDESLQTIASEDFGAVRTEWVDDSNLYVVGSSADNGTANALTGYACTVDLEDGSVANATQMGDDNRPQGNENNYHTFRHGGAMHRLAVSSSDSDMYLEGDAFIPQGSGGLPVSFAKYAEDNLVGTYTALAGCQVNGNDLGMFHIDSTNLKVSITTVTESAGNIGYNIGTGATIYSSESALSIDVLQLGNDRVFLAWMDSSGNIKAGIIKPKPTLDAGTKVTLSTLGAGVDTHRGVWIKRLSMTQVAVCFVDTNVNVRMVVCDIDVANKTVTPGDVVHNLTDKACKAGNEPWSVEVMDLPNKVMMVAYVDTDDNEVYTRTFQVRNKNELKKSAFRVQHTTSTTSQCCFVKKHPTLDLAALVYSAANSVQYKLLKP